MSFGEAVHVLVIRVQHIHRHQRCKIKRGHMKSSREQLRRVLQGRRDRKSIQASTETVKWNTGKCGAELHVGVCVVLKCPLKGEVTLELSR